jgi:hypothetical protein
MSSLRIFVGIVVCLVASAAGFVIGLALGGFGICAVSPSLGMVGASAGVGALFAGSIAFLWPKAWSVGALAFSVPALFGAALGASTGEWQRIICIVVCIVASILAAFVIRYPDPRSLKL